ncbi:hypothetical protein [Burkholderia pseudomallei]|uniref:hypothetical protein n=1 Tax=Burkholderia pseudomallei TaxID=28450 RepID=UPI0030035D8C
MVSGSRFAVRGSRFAVRGSRFAVRGSRFAVRGSRFAVRGSRFAVRGSRFAVRGSRFAVRGSRFAVCGLWFAVRDGHGDAPQACVVFGPAAGGGQQAESSGRTRRHVATGENACRGERQGRLPCLHMANRGTVGPPRCPR